MLTIGLLLQHAWRDIKASFGSGKKHMQNIEKPGTYYGTWGVYQLELAFFPTGNYWVATTLREGKPLDVSKPLPSAVDGIKHVANWLEGHGCRAFVDGEIRKLHDFLSFETAKS